MAFLTQFLHQISYRLTRRSQAGFEHAATRLQASQQARFRRIMALVSGSENGYKLGLTQATTPDEFRQRVAITEYEDWQPLINRQRSSGEHILTTKDCQRYQPTSGSTSQIKWIPYTPAFLHELDQTISPWVADLYQRFPGIRRGRHYWSLSWVPSELRSAAASVNDDLQLLPWWKRLFMRHTMAVPEQVSLAPSSELSLFASLCYLCASRDLTLMSVWSPTFLLSLLEQLGQQREAVAQVLEQGQWGAERAGLNFLNAPRNRTNAAILRAWTGQPNANITRQLWPQLALISAWDTSSSASWAQQLQQLFSHAGFQGKGLWATEGVVTFPYANQYPLALQSHFYEFENLANGDLLYSWELQPGMRVRPIITTGNGLLRYRTKDQLEVEGFLHQCPTLRFISRLSGTDLVGEKMAPEGALQIMQALQQNLPIRPLSLLAVPATDGLARATYVLLANGDPAHTDSAAAQLEQQLAQHFHYQLARELGQLDAARVILSDNAVALYNQLRMDAGAVAGNIKAEPLLLCPQAATLLQPSAAELIRAAS